MTRQRVLLSIVLVALALVAGACGAPDDGALRALPRGGGSAGSEAAAMMAADASTSASGGSWAPYQPVTYVRGKGVTAPTKAKAYELGGGEPSKADVTRLATALRIDGAVETEERAYRVTDGDTVLEVRRNAVGSWMVSNDSAISVMDSCAVAVDRSKVDPDPAGAAPDAPVSSERPVTDDQPADLCPEQSAPKNLLSGSEAVRRVQQILEVGGSSAFEYDVAEADSSTRSTAVEVNVSFDGHALPELGSWWEFGEDGILFSAMGFLGSPEALGDYPLVSAAEAVERLNGREGGGVLHDSVTEPAPAPRLADDGVAEPAIGIVDCPPEADCVAPEPGPAPEPLEPREMEISGVTLVYSLLPTGPCEDDTVLLVPAFELEHADGSVWVEAITDEHLADAADNDGEYTPCPEDADGQEPGREPGTGSGGAGGIEPVPLPAEAEPAPAPELESKVATTSR